jgi:tRNA A37 threonylcarbamoyladenosine modification protein TsaB
MYKIYIDSTKRYEKLVRLLSDEEIVSEKFGDIDIVSSIEELLKENSLKIADIKVFSANPGPGSFTGIKLGITIANVLNWSLGIFSLSGLQKPAYGREPNISKKRDSAV